MMTRFLLRTLIALANTGTICLRVVIVVSINDNSALEMTTSVEQLQNLLNDGIRNCN